jgi:hypothetical protein
MKVVQDNHGNEITVATNAPCHGGVNGALPILYTLKELMIINEQQAIDKAEWDNGAIVRKAQAKIVRLEGQVTQRRIRDAIVGTDNGWLISQEALIAIERARLR